MLLVTFHGGSSGINNVYGYGHKHGKLEQEAALAEPGQGKLSELRAMVLANGVLYVANGAKSQSTVLAYPVPSTLPSSGPWFTNPSVLIGPTMGNTAVPNVDRSSVRDRFRECDHLLHIQSGHQRGQQGHADQRQVEPGQRLPVQLSEHHFIPGRQIPGRHLRGLPGRHPRGRGCRDHRGRSPPWRTRREP